MVNKLTILALVLFTISPSFPSSVLAQTTSIIPTKLAIIYTSPEKENTGIALTPAEVAQKFQVAVWARKQGQNSLPGYISAGYTGLALQYFVLNESMMAPPTFSDALPTNASPYCTQAEKDFQPYSNNITLTRGSFCELHDSLIGRLKNDAGKKFDHDLNPATPAIWADESWFVHRTDTGKRYITQGALGKNFFANHAHPDWQAYFTARALEQLEGSTRYPAFGMNGIFLDNLDLSWHRLTNLGSTPKEFTASTAFVQSEIQFVTSIYTALRTNNRNFYLFANMTEGADSTSDWDKFSPILDGGMKEDFLLNWGRGPYSSTTALNQIAQAEKWIASGKHYLAVSPGNMWYGRTTFDQHALYTLAAQLLATDSVNSSFKYYNEYGNPSGSRSQFYHEYYDYPQYYYQLGTPLGPKYQSSTVPLVYKRDFQCGQAVVNFTERTGTITRNLNCQTTTPDPKQIILDYLKTSSPSDLNSDTKVNTIDFALSRQ